MVLGAGNVFALFAELFEHAAPEVAGFVVGTAEVGIGVAFAFFFTFVPTAAVFFRKITLAAAFVFFLFSFIWLLAVGLRLSTSFPAGWLGLHLLRVDEVVEGVLKVLPGGAEVAFAVG